MIYDTDILLINMRLDKFEEELKKLKNEVKVLSAYVDTQLYNKYYPNVYHDGGSISCYFDNLSPEERMKPMSVSCPCPKCSPYSMS